MKKILLIILGLTITNISFCPVEKTEGFDPIKAAEESRRVEKEHQEAYEKHLSGRSPATLLQEVEQERNQTITNLRNMGTEDVIKKVADIATDYAKQTPSSTRTNNLATFIDQTYTTARLSNPDNIKSMLDGLDQLNNQFLSNTLLREKIATKVNQFVNAIINQIKGNESYKQKLNSETIASLFKNLDTMQDRKINITDSINALITTIAPNIVVNALENQSITLKSRAFDTIMKRGEAYIKQLDGKALTRLLQTRIDIAEKNDPNLIDDYTKILTNASTNTLSSALLDEQARATFFTVLSKILAQPAAIPERAKSIELHDLFKALQKITPKNPLILTMQRVALENIKDFTFLETAQERLDILTALKEIAPQVTSMSDSKQKTERQANMIEILDRFATLPDKTVQELSSMADILKTIPTTEAIQREAAIIRLGLSEANKKESANLINKALDSFLQRNLPLEAKLNFLAITSNDAVKQKAPASVQQNINDRLFAQLALATSVENLPQTLFQQSTGFTREDIFKNLAKTKIWNDEKQMKQLEAEFGSTLMATTDANFLKAMLATKPVSLFKEFIIDRAIQLVDTKPSPEKLRSLFETIIQDASQKDLERFFNNAGEQLTSGQLWLMYMHLQSNVKNRINDFINIIANKAQNEQWPISEFEKLGTDTPQYPLGLELLRKQSRPFISTTYSLDWIDSLNRLGLTGNDKAYFTKQQMSMLDELANRYETLTSNELTRLEKIATAMEQRIASVKDDPASLDHNLRILRKVNDVINERNWRTHWPILSSFIRFFKSFNLTAANALETQALLNNFKTKLEGFEQNKDVIDALKNIDTEIDQLKTLKK